MKKVILISLLVVSLLSARQVFVDTNDALSVKVSSNITNIDNENINENSVRSSREEITLFEWDFETDDWNTDDGWQWTDTDYNSDNLLLEFRDVNGNQISLSEFWSIENSYNNQDTISIDSAFKLTFSS